MKKKIWILIIILITAGVCVAAYFIWFTDKKKLYQPEVLEPEVFNDVEFNPDLIIGLWRENELYYRYNEDGSAATWDLADDVMEDEGTQLEWDITHDILTHYYEMEIGGIIPKMFNIKQLELDSLVYYDDYGVYHRFVKVEELQLIN